MRLEDWLDDLCVRFIINLPREELESVERICFQVEEAQWFYEDFIRPLDPNLPSMSLRQFALRIFQHCPLMSEWSHYHRTVAFSEFLAYKTRVPVRGAILLNDAMDEVVLVKGWKKGASWSFPRGKINKDEKDFDCAVREVYEETGFDIKAAGLADDEEKLKYIELPMREQNMRLYVIRGVPKDAHFEPRTRKEISKIEWYKLSDLPTLKKHNKQPGPGGQNAHSVGNKFYMVAPFLGPLRKWIAQQKKQEVAKTPKLAQETPQEVVDAKSSNVEPPIPSDLPEVANPEDASAHLKRLLNIKTTPPPQAPAPKQPSGNALLALLKQGSGGLAAQESSTTSQAPPSFHPDKTSSHPLPQSFNWQSNFLNHSPHLHPPSHLGIPHGQLHLGNTGNGYHQPYTYNSEIYPSPSTTYKTSPTSHYPAFQFHPSVLPPQNLPQVPAPVPPRPPAQYPRTAPAPYQRTGDPEFAELTQGGDGHLSSVPPASKLPLPKLTSHSLALLNVFKSDTKKVEASNTASSSQPTTQQQMETSDKSKHQNNLSNLLNRQESKPSSTPASQTPTTRAELAAPSTSPDPAPKVEAVQILKKEMPSRPLMAATQGNEPTPSSPISVPKPRATKSMGKQPLSSPKNAAKVPQKAKPPTITILPRPTQNKESPPPSLPFEPGPEAPRPQAHRNVRLSDLTKPFQPKILRRPEKGNLEACLPTHTVTVSAFSRADQDSVEKKEEKEVPKTLDYDRRPSQTAAQKEVLLSLFGKGPQSPEGQKQGTSPLPVSPPPPPPPRSTTVSPLETSTSQVKPLASCAKHTSPDSASESTRSKVTSPVDKAFLLGYLEGVAKGKR
ncbi:hypothetical protein VTO42DRAFT_1571 [Malbranchea cinnamomea]